jgi:hypothetical protein
MIFRAFLNGGFFGVVAAVVAFIHKYKQLENCAGDAMRLSTDILYKIRMEDACQIHPEVYALGAATIAGLVVTGISFLLPQKKN